MNLNIKIFLLCPIPDDQKPITEYINLKENDLTNWILLNQKDYFLKIGSYFLIFFIFSTPLTFLLKLNEELFLFNSFFALNVLITIFLVSFSRWLQLLKRLRSSRIFYEEGSWYDGQFWEKPIELIKNDKLLTTQKIQPILKRIVRTLIILITLTISLYINYISI